MKKKKLKVTLMKDMTVDQLYEYVKRQEKNLENARGTFAEAFFVEFVWMIRKEIADRF